MNRNILFCVEHRVSQKWESIQPPENYQPLGDIPNWCIVQNGTLHSVLIAMKGFRGLPKDTSYEVMVEAIWWGKKEDDSRVSHLTLAELLAFSWDQEVTIVERQPQRHWRDVSKVVLCINDDYYFEAKAISRKEGELPLAERAEAGVDVLSLYSGTPYKLANKTTTYKAACANFYCETLPAIQQVGDPEDVRVVFWFDT